MALPFMTWRRTWFGEMSSSSWTTIKHWTLYHLMLLIQFHIHVHAKALPFTSSVWFNSKVVCMQAQVYIQQSTVTNNTRIFLFKQVISISYIICNTAQVWSCENFYRLKQKGTYCNTLTSTYTLQCSVKCDKTDDKFKDEKQACNQSTSL